MSAGGGARGSSAPLFPRWLWALFGIAVVGWLIMQLRSALTPVFFAVMVAYVLDPLADRMEKRKIPRSAAVAILLVGGLLIGVLVALLVVPAVIREIAAFVAELPDQLTALVARTEPWLLSHGITPPHSVKDALSQVGMNAQGLAGKVAAPTGAALLAIWGGTTSAIGLIANLVIVPVFAFYLLYDWDRIVAGVRDLIPWRVRPQVVDIAREIDDLLGEFVRGQLLVMGLLTLMYGVAYSLIGVRLAIPIAIVAGIIAFIPYVGGAVALGLALLMCLLAGAPLSQYLLVIGAYTVIQILEGFVITPRIMEDKLGLGAVWVLLALMVFGELFGFLGVLLALPLAAVCKVLTLRAVSYYRATPLFLVGAPDDEAGSVPDDAPPTPDDAEVSSAADDVARDGGSPPHPSDKVTDSTADGVPDGAPASEGHAKPPNPDRDDAEGGA
ncbi:MAG: AI-2E family transporter [Polyangiaceae bacterium]|nr:AI-2E family transporter [Polyangiaceae bacterium]